MADSDDSKDEIKAAAGVKGGKARAEALSPEERREIAAAAAAARWGTDDGLVRRATHPGELEIANLKIPVFVLDDGTRVISGRGFTSVLGMKGRGQGMTRILTHRTLKPYISNELVVAIEKPLVFKSSGGGRPVHGYGATLLVEVAEAILAARDAGALRTEQEYRYGAACEILIRALARVGIIALIDEATGYQEIRDRAALQKLLDRYLRDAYAKWAKRFPDEFYQEMFRLRGWEWRGMKVNRPQVVAHYTKDIVYARLAPGILKELEERNPKDERGNRRAKHHQFLTDEIGHPALQGHLGGVTALMRISTKWDEFMKLLQRAYPKVNTTLDLPFNDSSRD